MEISRKTDYALRMLADLVREPEAIISVRRSAEQNSIPYSFARAIQHDLTRAGFIESVRGARGGMMLAAGREKATMLEIVEAMQGPVLFSECDVAGDDGDACPIVSSCSFVPVWCNARSIMRAYLGSVTLEDVVVKGLVPNSFSDFELVSANKSV